MYIYLSLVHKKCLYFLFNFPKLGYQSLMNYNSNSEEADDVKRPCKILTDINYIVKIVFNVKLLDANNIS